MPPDNKAAERALRRPVIARYATFGSGGPAGAETVGPLWSVFETVRMAGLNPYAFALDYLQACARNCGRPPERLDPWLPWLMDDSRKRELSRPPERWAEPGPAARDDSGSAIPAAA